MEGLLTLLLYAGFFYLMMRMGCGSHMAHGHHDKAEAKEEDVFIDPVCGEQVAEDQGYGELVEGRLFRFCSKQCLDTFDQNIAEYSKKPNKFSVKKEHHHEA
jgi:YHS domain-containing protein